MKQQFKGKMISYDSAHTKIINQRCEVIRLPNRLNTNVKTIISYCGVPSIGGSYFWPKTVFTYIKKALDNISTDG